MTISDYHISSVIKTYVKNMRWKVDGNQRKAEEGRTEDQIIISEDGMKRMVFERIDERMAEKLKKHGND